MLLQNVVREELVHGGSLGFEKEQKLKRPDGLTRKAVEQKKRCSGDEYVQKNKGAVGIGYEGAIDSCWEHSCCR